MLRLLGNLPAAPTLSHSELLHLVQTRRLRGRGLSPGDVHLLGSCLLAQARLRTRDRRLSEAAEEIGLLEPGSSAKQRRT